MQALAQLCVVMQYFNSWLNLIKQTCGELNAIEGNAESLCQMKQTGKKNHKKEMICVMEINIHIHIRNSDPLWRNETKWNLIKPYHIAPKMSTSQNTYHFA